jgi:ParB family chromosome partitioning protein
MAGVESAATLPPVCRLQAEAAGTKPPLPRAPEGKQSKNPACQQREGHPYQVFFCAPATALDATTFSGGPADHHCSAFVPGLAAMLWSEFWSGRGAGANGPELGAKRSGVSNDENLPISSGHIALAAVVSVISTCAQEEEGGAKSAGVGGFVLSSSWKDQVELEFHQLELRYERLKVARPEPERRLLASLAEVGQQVPVVVVKEAAEGSFVVIDGYKRVRALRRLGRDTVGASCWPGEEAEALIVTRLMQTAEPETALEQSWLLAELRERFGFSLQELARRFGHSVSWVSRRLALLQDLPEAIQERVRRGQIGAHGAAKYLVPLARANRQVCLDLMETTGATGLSSRDLGILYTAYQTGNWVTRQRLLEAPLVFLKSHKEMQAPPSVEPGLSDSLLTDLEILSATARRADRRLRAGILRNVPEKDRQDLSRLLEQSRHEMQRMAEHFAEEMSDARSKHPSCDSETAATGA